MVPLMREMRQRHSFFVNRKNAIKMSKKKKIGHSLRTTDGADRLLLSFSVLNLYSCINHFPICKMLPSGLVGKKPFSPSEHSANEKQTRGTSSFSCAFL